MLFATFPGRPLYLLLCEGGILLFCNKHMSSLQYFLALRHVQFWFASFFIVCLFSHKVQWWWSIMYYQSSSNTFLVTDPTNKLTHVRGSKNVGSYRVRILVFNLAPSENRDFGPPPHTSLDFGAIAYWSRAFLCNRLRLLIGRELAQLPLAGNYCHCFSSRTASDASTACSRLMTVHF